VITKHASFATIFGDKFLIIWELRRFGKKWERPSRAHQNKRGISCARKDIAIFHFTAVSCIEKGTIFHEKRI
jgi:hypothetical protein